MAGYATVGANNVEKAVAFYEELMGVAGWAKAFDHPRGGRIWRSPSGDMFGVLKPFDEKPATVGNGGMIGLGLDSPAQVDALHAKALALGGADEGAPGPRGGGAAYFAYFRDLDGNKLCAYKFG